MAAAKKTTKSSKAKSSTTKKKAAPRRTQQKYYRNLRAVPVGLRLEESDRKINLAARGQRGDIAPVKKGEANDPIYLSNVDMLFEVITKEEADAIIEKQATNIQDARRTHPAWDNIRRPDGEQYDQEEIRREAPEESQGYTIAQLDEEGNVPLERQGQKGIQIKRAALPGSEDNPLPDIPDGVAPEDQANYLHELRASKTVGETETE